MKTPIRDTQPPPEVQRSASQIMFGHLPEQTVDINRGVWKVAKWRDPRIERAVDTSALQAEVLKQAKPWIDAQRDNQFGARLLGGRRSLKVAALARDRGVDVEPFPKVWLCRVCRRVHRSAGGTCACGAQGARDQIHFVCYCKNCGSLAEPPIVSCNTHQATRISFPGTMAAEQIIQDCPDCGRVLRKGFAGKVCPNCSQPMDAQVHRSSAVYTPRTAVIVNPPDRALLERIDAAGGGARALSWVLSGLKGRWMDAVQGGRETLREALLKQGLSPALVDDLVQRAEQRGEVGADPVADLPPDLQSVCEQEAKHIAVALASSRQTLEDMQRTAPAGLRAIYTEDYPPALRASGLEAVEYVDKFPVLTGAFGYTRGPSNDATRSVLVPFVDSSSDYLMYGEVNETEALFVRLAPRRVASWLRQRGHSVLEGETDASARIGILSSVAADVSGATEADLITLVHSFAHRLIRLAAVHTGVERTSLSEFLVPHHLGFFMYAATRGDFIMGGLQAVFEGELQNLLADFVDAEHRCALDPGCADTGGACMACLHLGEPSCRLFNQSLDRSVLHGSDGYVGS